MLAHTRDCSEEDDMLEEEGGEYGPVPQLGFWQNVPKLPGQDTNMFQKWHQRLQQARKVLNIECDKSDFKYIRHLVTVTKENNLFALI